MIHSGNRCEIRVYTTTKTFVVYNSKRVGYLSHEIDKLKTAKICNLIGTIAVGVFVVLYIVFFVVVAAIGMSAA